MGGLLIATLCLGLGVAPAMGAKRTGQGRPVVRSAFSARGGGPDVRAMLAFLEAVPVMSKDLAVARALERRGRFGVLFEDEVRDRLGSVPGPEVPIYSLLGEDRSFIIAKREVVGQRRADLFYMLAHEIVHVGDRERLARALVRHRRALPRDLFSRVAAEITSRQAIPLPDGYYVDRSLFIFMTEQRAYYAMNRLHDALMRNRFAKVRFAGRDHLEVSRDRPDGLAFAAAPRDGFEDHFPGATRDLVAEALGRAGIDRATIRRMQLPARMSPVRAYVLAQYVRRAGSSSQIDVDAPHFSEYCNLSVKQILSGALRDGR